MWQHELCCPCSLHSVKSFADEVKRKCSRLDALVNNAGCNFVPSWRTSEGVLGIVQVCMLLPASGLLCASGQPLNIMCVIAVATNLHPEHTQQVTRLLAFKNAKS
jgi:NAD(P)-dependent dehydrogenase (short-subunit alcohol dehydrogenase family)